MLVHQNGERHFVLSYICLCKLLTVAVFVVWLLLDWRCMCAFNLQHGSENQPVSIAGQEEPIPASPAPSQRRTSASHFVRAWLGHEGLEWFGHAYMLHGWHWQTVPSILMFVLIIYLICHPLSSLLKAGKFPAGTMSNNYYKLHSESVHGFVFPLWHSCVKVLSNSVFPNFPSCTSKCVCIVDKKRTSRATWHLDLDYHHNSGQYVMQVELRARLDHHASYLSLKMVRARGSWKGWNHSKQGRKVDWLVIVSCVKCEGLHSRWSHLLRRGLLKQS